MNHFHIRWSSGKLDWQRFVTYSDAEATAKELVQPNETFTIEEFHRNCPQCRTSAFFSIDSSRPAKQKL
jgi:hypothetical protein